MAGATGAVTWQLRRAGTLSVPPSFNVAADAAACSREPRTRTSSSVHRTSGIPDV